MRWMLALRTVRQSSTQYASSKPRREQRAIRRSPSQYRMHSVAACDDGQRHGSGSGPFGEGRVTQHQRPGVDSVPGGSRPRLGRTGGRQWCLLQRGADGNAQVTGTKTYSKRIARAPSANEVCRPCISRLRRAEPVLCAICSTKGRMPGSSTITATSRSIWLASACSGPRRRRHARWSFSSYGGVFCRRSGRSRCAGRRKLRNQGGKRGRDPRTCSGLSFPQIVSIGLHGHADFEWREPYLLASLRSARLGAAQNRSSVLTATYTAVIKGNETLMPLRQSLAAAA